MSTLPEASRFLSLSINEVSGVTLGGTEHGSLAHMRSEQGRTLAKAMMAISNRRLKWLGHGNRILREDLYGEFLCKEGNSVSDQVIDANFFLSAMRSWKMESSRMICRGNEDQT